MFLRFLCFGKLTKDKPEENEDQMRNDAFFCFRSVFVLFFFESRKEVMCLWFKYFGKLSKENENQMYQNSFFCFR